MTKKLSIAKEYTTKNGEVKTQWFNAGVLITKQNGKEAICLDDTINLPAFAKDGKIWLNVVEPKEKEEDSSDIPF